MKYTIQTSKYILKNFFYILPFAIIPAFFLSLSISQEEIKKVIEVVFSGSLEGLTFYDVFCAISVFNFGSVEAIITGIIGMLAMVPCVALLMALLDKHMRFGKRTFNGLWAKLNDNFISTFGYTFLLLLIYEVWALLTAALVYFMSMIPVAVVAYITSLVVYVLMHVVLLYVLGMIYLWLPCMQITGFPAMEAWQYSYRLLTPVKWRVLSKQIILLFVVEGMIAACAVYFSGTLFSVVSTLLCAILLLFYCVRMETVYFDRDQIERVDLRRYY